MPTYPIGPETRRLRHRAFTPDDADALYRLNSHPEVMRYTCEPMLTSVAEARQAIIDYPDFRQHGFGRWACVLKSTDQIIGFCGLKYLDEFQAVDVGYRFFPEFWGQGLATEACRASVEFGFTTLQLPRILAFAIAENKASIRVLQKTGFASHGPTECSGVCALRFEQQHPGLPDLPGAAAVREARTTTDATHAHHATDAGEVADGAGAPHTPSNPATEPGPS